MSLTHKPSSRQANHIKLVHGQEGGQAAWYIVAVDPLKAPIYQHMLNSGNYDLTKAGSIIHTGWGDVVPPHILEEIREQF